MAIEIDRHDAEHLIREISAETGESPSELIHRLVLEEALQRRPAIGSPEYEARTRAFFAELDARPVLDGRDWREIEAELYDEHGQPIG